MRSNGSRSCWEVAVEPEMASRSPAMATMLPAVTCSVQASLVTGTLPRDHGIVGNGWYDRAEEIGIDGEAYVQQIRDALGRDGS